MRTRTDLIVRCEARGLGHQTRDMAAHLAVRPVLVDGGEPCGAPTVPASSLAEHLTGEIVFSAETFYDPGLTRVLSARGQRAICHVNPEFFVPDELVGAEIWLPTPWLAEHFPGAPVVPVPVPFARPPRPTPARPVFLHVAGRRTVGDRNGTATFLRAAAVSRVRAVVTTQQPLPPVPDNVTVRVDPARWDIYEGCDVLVLPRRYGGLSLVVQEAMACGLAVLVPDCPPNDFWPTIRHPASPSNVMRGKHLRFRCHDTDVRVLADRMLHLSPAEIDDAKQASHDWARAHTWEALGDLWRRELC